MQSPSRSTLFISFLNPFPLFVRLIKTFDVYRVEPDKGHVWSSQAVGWQARMCVGEAGEADGGMTT